MATRKDTNTNGDAITATVDANERTTQLQKTRKAFEKALALNFEGQSSIKHEGKVIVVPTHMNYIEAAKTLMEYEKQQEATTEKILLFQCHPHDGMVCFYRAMQKEFGNILGAESVGFFGQFIPPQSFAVPIGFNETLTVPVGAMEVPGLPVKMDIGSSFNNDNPVKSKFYVKFAYPRKYEPLILEIEKLTHKELKENSIFRGKAINSDYEFIDLSVDTSGMVYTIKEMVQLDANLFGPITRRAEYKKNRISLKRTILFHGNFGTGKTMTALVAAKKCIDNGWTFMNVKPDGSITAALNFALEYQPCVVFFEDVDVATSGDRSERLNDVLNTIDGFGSKNAQIVTVLTTNRIDVINKAMLRPGRIDTILEMGVLDEYAVKTLVKTSGGDIVDPDDIDAHAAELFQAAEGYVQAFIVEAVTKAKSYAICGNNGDSKLHVTAQNVVDALEELRPQFKLMMGEQTIAEPTIDKALRRAIRSETKRAVEIINYGGEDDGEND